MKYKSLELIIEKSLVKTIWHHYLILMAWITVYNFNSSRKAVSLEICSSHFCRLGLTNKINRNSALAAKKTDFNFLVHLSLNPKCTSKLFFDSYVLVLSDYSEWICRWYLLSIEFFLFSFLLLF